LSLAKKRGRRDGARQSTRRRRRAVSEAVAVAESHAVLPIGAAGGRVAVAGLDAAGALTALLGARAGLQLDALGGAGGVDLANLACAAPNGRAELIDAGAFDAHLTRRTGLVRGAAAWRGLARPRGRGDQGTVRARGELEDADLVGVALFVAVANGHGLHAKAVANRLARPDKGIAVRRRQAHLVGVTHQAVAALFIAGAGGPIRLAGARGRSDQGPVGACGELERAELVVGAVFFAIANNHWLHAKAVAHGWARPIKGIAVRRRQADVGGVAHQAPGALLGATTHGWRRDARGLAGVGHADLALAAHDAGAGVKRPAHASREGIDHVVTAPVAVGVEAGSARRSGVAELALAAVSVDEAGALKLDAGPDEEADVALWAVRIGEALDVAGLTRRALVIALTLAHRHGLDADAANGDEAVWHVGELADEAFGAFEVAEARRGRQGSALTRWLRARLLRAVAGVFIAVVSVGTLVRGAALAAAEVAEEAFAALLVGATANRLDGDAHALARRRGRVFTAVRGPLPRGPAARGAVVHDAGEAGTAIPIGVAAAAAADPATLLLEQDGEGALGLRAWIAGLLAFADLAAVDDDVAKFAGQAWTGRREIDALVVVAAATVVAAGDDHAGVGEREQQEASQRQGAKHGRRDVHVRLLQGLPFMLCARWLRRRNAGPNTRAGLAPLPAISRSLTRRRTARVATIDDGRRQPRAQGDGSASR
jgi:hypothetical protein